MKNYALKHKGGLGVEAILRTALNRKTLDNITVVLICFNNFKQALFSTSKNKQKSSDAKPAQNQLQGQENRTKLVESSKPSLCSTAANEVGCQSVGAPNRSSMNGTQMENAAKIFSQNIEPRQVQSHQAEGFKK